LQALNLFITKLYIRLSTCQFSVEQVVLVIRVRDLQALHLVLGSGFRVPGFGFRVLGSGFRVSGSGFRVAGCGLRVAGCGFRVPGFGFRRAQGFGGWVEQCGLRVPSCKSSGVRCSQFGIPGIVSRAPGFRFRVSCVGIRVTWRGCATILPVAGSTGRFSMKCSGRSSYAFTFAGPTACGFGSGS